MNLETVALFCHVVRLQSFSRGAALAGVTQPAASQAIRQLEEGLGVQLLDRSMRPFSVTPAGEKFFRASRRLLEGFERVRAEITQDRQRIGGPVRVAAIYSVGLHEMGALMQQFRVTYPDARIRLECLHPEEVVHSVIEDTADVGILSYPPASRALTIIPLRRDPLSFVCPPEHPLARKKIIGSRDLAREPLIAFDPELPIRKAIDRTLRRHHVRMEIVLELDNLESIKQAVLVGTGVSILPVPSVQREVDAGTLCAIPLEMVIRRPIGLIHRRLKHLSPAVARFIEMMLAK